MTGSINFRNLSQAAPVRPSAPLQRTAAPSKPETSAPAERKFSPTELAKPGGGVHMAEDEMQAHIEQALSDSPVLNDQEAPLIDPEHLDAAPEEVAESTEVKATEESEASNESEELEETEEGAEAEEEAELEAPEMDAPEEAEDYLDQESESENEAGEPSENLADYLKEELYKFQKDRLLPDKRLAHLIVQAGRSRKVEVAVAIETQIGGLAAVLAGMRGDFIFLSGTNAGSVIDHIGVARNQPFIFQAFRQALLNHLSLPQIDCVLLDLEFVPLAQRPAVLAVLKEKPASKKILVFQGPGKLLWK
ncbi:hypothetical protein COW36_18955 [bacterium (Candidatus Blackallbacteria) CG17_big_fil_post_rev_8_21_14_2_50_48_46]|uniref:Uncharacterized protein n=1 Tax=bacterium (Candidatus Blackallbacteria) CG17_big_fil_post_rev_8_21_14_2_50_48_46 TaxID=2014261 RepID=A0A2M7G055_9BACT|nr:MAG: hypothetical protein COW64_25515 [bacterium (Candidatus Blackallbacteria) CG18_big_fil_WC_8_21_14_2_50_49_26]PIW15007.1 MAG: hypothetical protein COW36_18955 [bacterium (Candidatus Blackallbacteria) CG17_big_fil_post_rev_8_21_14_2_50_48_46]PIW50088.1 MAG: hypothetical protein COW20_03890 [bacterium (Candidatus Blackallbacteria) CG13_big_fil_rev_8_21_14_2_50_49_14]